MGILPERAIRRVERKGNLKNMELKYMELKSGYNDNGPAWIGWGKSSQSGKTVYFNDHAFQKAGEGKDRYYDVETGENWWISGVKKNGLDRHWAGSGYDRIQIARDAVNQRTVL